MAKTVNVRAFGAIGDGDANDSAAFQNAINAAGAGGVVYAPEGVYRISNLTLLSGQSLIGNGRKSILKKGPLKPDGSASSGILVQIFSVSQVLVSNLTIDVATSTAGAGSWNFSTCVYVLDSADVTVQHCQLLDSSNPVGNANWTGGPPWTIHAVLAQSSSLDGNKNLRVLHNNCYHTQIKVGWGRNILVQGNTIERPMNLGISSVLQQDSQTFDTTSIVDNMVIDPAGHGGIFVGSDVNDDDVGVFRRLTVRGNTISGQAVSDVGNPPGWSNSNVCGIYARPCRVSEDWVIDGNVIRFDDPLTTNGSGIVMVNVDGTSLKRCSVRGNVVHNVDQQGIAISSLLDDVIVEGNVLGETRGMWISGRTGGTSKVSVLGNRVRGKGHQAFQLYAFTGSMDAEFHGNVAEETGTGVSGSRGLDVLADSGKTMTLRASNNRLRNAQIGVSESGAGTFDTAYYHNDARGNGTAMSVGGGAYLHENRTS